MISIQIAKIVQNARPILAKACCIIVECVGRVDLRLGKTISEDSTFRPNDHNSGELGGEGPHGLNVCPS